jgi:hypothetical protein
MTTVAANNRVHSVLGTYSRGRLWLGALLCSCSFMTGLTGTEYV